MKTIAEIIDMVEEYGRSERQGYQDWHERLADIERAIKEREARKHYEEMLLLLNDINNWLVCWPIATPEDMGQSFQHFQEEIDALLEKIAGDASTINCKAVA